MATNEKVLMQSIMKCGIGLVANRKAGGAPAPMFMVVNVWPDATTESDGMMRAAIDQENQIKVLKMLSPVHDSMLYAATNSTIRFALDDGKFDFVVPIYLSTAVEEHDGVKYLFLWADIDGFCAGTSRLITSQGRSLLNIGGFQLDTRC